MENIPPQNSGTHQYMSRRERRELMRSQKGQGSAGGMWRGKTRRMLIWGGSLAVIMLIGWGMVKLSDNVVLPTENGALSVPVSNLDNIQGPASASVTLVEYSDFQCPACAAFFPIVVQALAEPELKDKIQFVYRHFPLAMHPNARRAAEAAQAAAVQGKFWEMHDLLFSNQDAWAPLSSSAAKTAFTGYAESLGLDQKKFLEDMESSAVRDRVKADVDSGNASGVNSTPTFFVNGVQMAQPRSYDEFKQFLLNALNANP